MKIFLPNNLKLEQLISENQPNFNFNYDKALYFLHLLTALRVSRRNLNEKDGYVAISSQLLQKYGVRDFKNYREYFLKAGVIECTSYSESKARKFRFKEKYWTDLEVLKAPDNRFWCKVVKIRTDFIKSKVQKGATNLDILQYFNGSLTMCYSEAIDFIKEEFEKGKLLNAETAYHKYLQRKISVQYIKDSHFFSSWDDYGRLHTNLTNLSTDLRQFLRWNGEPLSNIDFVNSQPMLSSLLFEPKFWQSDSMINYKNLKSIRFQDYRSWHPSISQTQYHMPNAQNLSANPQPVWQTSHSEKRVKDLFTSSYSLSSYSSYHLSNTLILTKEAIPLYSEDIQSFVSTTREGKFYEYFAERLGLTEVDRKIIKATIFTAFFGFPTEGRKRLSVEKKLFVKAFPNVVRLFDIIKRKGPSKLAHMMQSIESKLVFEHLVPHLQEEFTDMPIFTIHDSFLVPQSMAEEVKEAVSIKFNEVLGFTPMLKVE